MDAASQAAYPVDLLALVEAYLEALDFGVDARASRLVEAMRYSLLAGGKRIRPVLTLATARSLDVEPSAVLPTAAALELIHTYSLIHDDLPAIDDDTLRRGRPTCHVAFGEDVAILAGDGLFAEAFHVLLTRQKGSPAALVATLREIAAATGVQGMVGGQYMDVAGLARDDDDLRTLHQLKTGRLIEAAVVCGAVLSGAGDAARLALEDGAELLGDDLLEGVGPDPPRELFVVAVEDRLRRCRQEDGLVGSHLDLHGTECLALPGELHAEREVLLLAGVFLLVPDALDRDGERPGDGHARLRPRRHGAERSLEGRALRRVDRSEVEVLAESVVAEVELPKRRTALHDERRGDGRFCGNRGEQVADRVVLQDRLVRDAGRARGHLEDRLEFHRVRGQRGCPGGASGR